MPPDDETRTLHRADVLVAPLPVILRTASAEKRLASGTCVIGSGSKADLVIDDPAVSRTHAELTLCPEGVHVKDLGSRNGTFYLGQRITSAVLSPGTRITLGASAVTIDLDTEHLAESSPARGASFRGLFGSSPAMARLFTTLSRLDGSLVPVLVHGESGVGKELVARAIHEGSRVSSGPFVPVNCGAIARELVASMLFGHARGAFTGALDARKGAFLAAHGGTLFLDEIGELPLEVQPALLRALESGEIVPVGKDVPQQVRVRLVAATHRDLRALVAEGRFREDLFYRLAVVALEIPPLRDRREDIPELARLFAREEGAADLDDDFVAEMSQRAFPGNVRELRNAVLSYIAIGAMPPARPSMLPPPPTSGSSFAPRFDAPYLAQRDAIVESFTREYLTKLLEATKGNQSEAARIAGLDRTYLGRMLAKMGIGRK
jgi:DNA-binding NtrC family response regulator